MKQQEITELIDYLKGVAVVPGGALGDTLFKEAALHLKPLPGWWAMKNARVWGTMPKLDAQGRSQTKFLNNLPEILDAVGVSLAARPDLARAAVEGAMMLPDLRNVNGLTYVGPGGAIPQGCYEYLKLNDIPVPKSIAERVKPVEYLPAPSAEPVLSLPPPDVPDAVVQFVDRAAIVRKKREEAKLARVDDVQDLIKLVAVRDDIPEPVKAAIKRLAFRYDAQVFALEEQRRYYQERFDETLEAMAAEAAALDGMLTAFEYLATKVRAQYPGALALVVERVVKTIEPTLSNVRVTIGRDDPLLDDSPINRVVVDCRAPVRPPTPPTPAPDRVPSRSRSTRAPVRLGDALKARR